MGLEMDNQDTLERTIRKDTELAETFYNSLVEILI